MPIKFLVQIIQLPRLFRNLQIKSKLLSIFILNFRENSELLEQMKKTREIVNNHDK